MGILDEDIARVRAATDFVALASEHLALRRSGRRWVGLCPFHTESTPSFSINAEDGLYYCFGCRASGDVITFVRELEHLDFAEAVESLASRAGITLRYDDGSGGAGHQRRSRVHETLERAVAWYHERLLTGADAGRARAYLRAARGYDGDVVRQYRLGWAPEGWDQLIRALKLPPAALADAGLANVSDNGRYHDFFRGRLLFPIFEAGGRPVGAGGRILPGGQGPKYKNTSNTAVYDKSRTLYGLNWAKKAIVDAGTVVVCEGYTDVIGLHLAGVGQAVATCGTALADGHIKLLTNFARRIVLAYDADAAGQSAAEQYYGWEQRYEVEIRVAAMAPGGDPADLARSDPGALEAAITGARPYLAFRLERLFARADLGTSEGRARAAQAAMALVGAHPNPLVRDQYVMEVADRCRLDPDRLRALPPPSRSEGPGSGGARRAQGSRGEQAGTGVSPYAGGPELPAVPETELQALRLAIQQPEEVADRLEEVLFAHSLSRRAFRCLLESATLHDAIESADPQVAALLQRLDVEEADAGADDVLVRLVERAGQRALQEVRADLRQAPPEDQAGFGPTVAWLKLQIEALRPGEGGDPALARGTEQLLVAWLVARDQPAPEQPASDQAASSERPEVPA